MDRMSLSLILPVIHWHNGSNIGDGWIFVKCEETLSVETVTFNSGVGQAAYQLLLGGRYLVIVHVVPLVEADLQNVMNLGKVSYLKRVSLCTTRMEEPAC